jgi:hypothetical protein
MMMNNAILRFILGDDYTTLRFILGNDYDDCDSPRSAILSDNDDDDYKPSSGSREHTPCSDEILPDTRNENGPPPPIIITIAGLESNLASVDVLVSAPVAASPALLPLPPVLATIAQEEDGLLLVSSPPPPPPSPPPPPPLLLNSLRHLFSQPLHKKKVMYIMKNIKLLMSELIIIWLIYYIYLY